MPNAQLMGLFLLRAAVTRGRSQLHDLMIVAVGLHRVV
jgi:hypothetical protein